MASARVRVGVVGFGSLGQFLVDKILNDPTASLKYELVFVWNRSQQVFDSPEGKALPAGVALENLEEFHSRAPQLIVEVAHPSITQQWAARFIEHADYFMGSPTAMADAEIDQMVREEAAKPNGHGVYVPAGALWGGGDISRMADTGSLRSLTVRMKKHPDSLKLSGQLAEKMATEFKPGTGGEFVVYSGPLRPLCSLAPNNVNTMACAAIAGHTVGFDGLHAELIADDRLEAHVIDVEALGPLRPDGSCLSVITQRTNPAAPGAVTGSATYVSFFGSMMRSGNMGNGVHLV